MIQAGHWEGDPQVWRSRIRRIYESAPLQRLRLDYRDGRPLHCLIWRSPAALGSAACVKCIGTRRQALSFLAMNRFSPRPTLVHAMIAVVLIGAAVTLGLTIWESQKGKTQAPAIIDNQPVSQGQR